MSQQDQMEGCGNSPGKVGGGESWEVPVRMGRTRAPFRMPCHDLQDEHNLL